MEPMKSKIKRMFTSANKDSFAGRGNVEEWEIRPGGMLVQKRTHAGSNQNSSVSAVSVSIIKVRVKYGSSYHEISISSQASFGELKKMLAEHTGVHHQDQRLIYKKKERDSKEYLDDARVKNGSKIVLIEDITSREKRCLEMIKSANIEKASKSLQQISLEVDKLGEKVTSLETTSKEGKVAEKDVDNLTENLMAKLVVLDGIVIEGELKLRKRMQERRVQKYIETLDDLLKLHNSTADGKDSKIPLQQVGNSIGEIPIPMQKHPVHNNGGKSQLRQQENSIGQLPTPMQKQPVESKQHNVTVQMPTQQQRPLRHAESVVVTTKWETFD